MFSKTVVLPSQARRESIIQKSQERITRFEQWKASGRKGGSRYVYGFGSRTPRDVCVPFDRRRSSSHTGLSRHSPNGSDSDYYRPQRRAISACSAVRRHCCIDINRLTGMSFSTLTQQHVRKHLLSSAVSEIANHIIKLRKTRLHRKNKYQFTEKF